MTLLGVYTKGGLNAFVFSFSAKINKTTKYKYKMKPSTKTKSKYHPVPIEYSIHWRYLHQDSGLIWRDIWKRPQYRKFSKATICRHMRKPISYTVVDNRHSNTGRPRLLSERQKRIILRQAEILRTDYGHFTVKRLKLIVGLEESVCDQTVRRVLREANFKYRHSRKKGILLRKDLKLRLKFARKCRALLSPTIWTEGIAFYLDGVGFTHKTHPLDQALAPRSMSWRKPNDGLDFNFTAKGSHVGSGGKVAHFMAAIAHGKGVILAEQYEGKINGEKFSDFIRSRFPTMFENSANSRGKLFLQDGDPSQNSKVARDAMEDVGARKFSIPARSPDLNPIENVFHNVKDKLREDAINENIVHETYEQFCERVKKTLMDFNPDVVDRTIESMPKRVEMIIKRKGQRIKY